MVARWGGAMLLRNGNRPATTSDHKGLVKIPRIFLALPNPTALAPTDARASSAGWTGEATFQQKLYHQRSVFTIS